MPLTLKLVASRFGRPAVLCCALLVCGAALAGRAQSGRRQQRPAEIAPVPTPTPEPTPVPRAEVEQIPLMLLSDDTQAFDRPGSSAYLMRDVIGQRLREAKSFDITGGAKSANRAEAHKLAKLEKKRFVVWFQLVARGGFGLPDMSGGSDQAVEIEFLILEPETGKSKGSGRVYTGRRRAGVGGIGLPGRCYPTGTTAREYELIEVSIEAADRVIRHFSVPLPPRCG